MGTGVSLTKIEFVNFKAFRRFHITLDRTNILVGPNNAGKSTVIGSLRVLEAALKRARSRNPERIINAPQQPLGYLLSRSALPISTENVSTDYEEVAACIGYQFSNGHRIDIHFPSAGQIYMSADTPKGAPRSAAQFKTAFPFSLTLVPQLGPLEHDEPLVERETVESALSTHRAPRHFRNYWRNNAANFGQFAALVARTWPGMEVELPELIQGFPTIVAMCCRENRATRELFWAGVGFQIWCQLLTHITRSEGSNLLVIDEPEIYLHPDVQRQLLGILRSRPVDVVLATHSTEIVGEADPEEVVLVDKTRTSAKRMRDVEGIQIALDSIGSIHNIALAQLARTKRLLFTEGVYDSKVIRRFATITGRVELGTGTGMTHVESDGFAGWERIRDFAWGLQKTVKDTLRIAAVFDRDYYPAEQINQLLESLRSHIGLAEVLQRKEIENYFLIPSVLQKALERTIADASRRGQSPGTIIDVEKVLFGLTEPLEAELQGVYLGKRWEYLRTSGRSIGEVNKESLTWFNQRWRDPKRRVEILPGKAVLALLRNHIKDNCKVNLTDARIFEAFHRQDVPSDMAEVIESLERFRTQGGTR